MADDVMVMYGGRAVEYGATRQILTHPEMPYTWGLLSSVPDVTADPEARLIPIKGNPPSLLRAADRLSVPPALPARRQGAGRPVQDDTARADGRLSMPRAGTSSAVTCPTRPRSTSRRSCPRSRPTWWRWSINDDFPEETGTGLVEDSPSDDALPKER